MFSSRLLLALGMILGGVQAATYTYTAVAPSSPDLDGLAVNAASGFELGGSPATYCPLTNQTQCPVGNETVFAGLTYLWVEVPGGQQTYVQSNGFWSFTQAHSSSTPPGAYIGGWVDVTTASGETVTSWAAPDNSTRGVQACPTATTPVNYQIWAVTPAFNRTDCTAIDGLLESVYSTGGFGAWQYV